MQPDLRNPHVDAIYNAAWQVRDLSRPHQRERKAEAVARLGLIVRTAFNSCDDFGPLLDAIREAMTI